MDVLREDFSRIGKRFKKDIKAADVDLHAAVRGKHRLGSKARAKASGGYHADVVAAVARADRGGGIKPHGGHRLAHEGGVKRPSAMPMTLECVPVILSLRRTTSVRIVKPELTT